MSSSLVLALVVLATMSGPLGAPRSLCMAASTIGQTACSLQVTIRALTARRAQSCARTDDLSFPKASLCHTALPVVETRADREMGHVRVRTAMPPPAMG